jgi:hypothetical protein
MAFTHGKNTKVYANGYDLTGFFMSSSSESTRDVAETTVFGLNEKTYLPGLRDATLSLEGRFDGAAAAVDERLSVILGADASSVWLIWPEGDVVGKRGAGFDALQTNYAVDAPLDDVVGVSCELQSNVGREAVISHHALGAETANQNGAAQDGGAATANGGAGYLQVTAFSGFTNIVVKVQDSVDGAAGWADILTFATVTAANAKERVAITGTVRRYTRYTITVTGSGSATFVVGFGRK